MKSQKLFVITVSICLLAVFVAGPAYSSSFPETKDEFCTEVANDSVNAISEISEATADMADCVDEYSDCTDGLFTDSRVECLSDGLNCVNWANSDQEQACASFANDFDRAYTRALRQSRNNGTEDLFLGWLNSSQSQSCLQPAHVITATCAGVIN